MKTIGKSIRTWKGLVAAALSLSFVPLTSALSPAEAKPPRHAPAYGYRNKDWNKRNKDWNRRNSDWNRRNNDWNRRNSDWNRRNNDWNRRNNDWNRRDNDWNRRNQRRSRYVPPRRNYRPNRVIGYRPVVIRRNYRPIVTRRPVWRPAPRVNYRRTPTRVYNQRSYRAPNRSTRPQTFVRFRY